jgi:hypothetical protein
MAVRDRNMFVWQAYVIASSIVSLILLVGMFFLWRAWNDATASLESEKEKNATQAKNAQETKGYYDRVMSMLGRGQWSPSDMEQMQLKYKDTAELGPIEQEFARMQTLFPAQTPLSDRNLLRLPQLLLDTIRNKNETLAEARTRFNALEAQATKDVDDHRRARQIAEEAQQKAEKDLADARTAHSEQIKKLNSEKEEAIVKFDSFKKLFDTQLADERSKVARLQAETNTQGETIAKQVDRIQQFENPDYAAPQGRITSVAEGGKVVWINLGKASGLRKGIPFSILDESDVQITNAVPKARLMILQLSEDGSSARGEVVFGNDSDSRTRYYRNPVKPGDQIYSPVWRPGRKVSFAMLGKMDINNDFADDSQQVKQLIESSGGVIDAELPARGPETGKITAYTNYLVIGTDVLDTSENPNATEKAKEYTKFMATAKKNGAIMITIDKLIGLLKIDESVRTIPLGNRIQGSDFKIRNQVTPPASTGNVSEIFNPDPSKP